jgi:hypothetical protein
MRRIGRWVLNYFWMTYFVTMMFWWGSDVMTVAMNGDQWRTAIYSALAAINLVWAFQEAVRVVRRGVEI